MTILWYKKRKSFMFLSKTGNGVDEVENSAYYRKLLDMADRVVRIDYGRSFRGSLSAASAATVMAFELFRQNKKT